MDGQGDWFKTFRMVILHQCGYFWLDGLSSNALEYANTKIKLLRLHGS